MLFKRCGAWDRTEHAQHFQDWELAQCWATKFRDTGRKQKQAPWVLASSSRGYWARDILVSALSKEYKDCRRTFLRLGRTWRKRTQSRHGAQAVPSYWEVSSHKERFWYSKVLSISNCLVRKQKLQVHSHCDYMPEMLRCFTLTTCKYFLVRSTTLYANKKSKFVIAVSTVHRHQIVGLVWHQNFL